MGKYWESFQPVQKPNSKNSETLSTITRSDEERKAILEKRIIDETRTGWHVRHQSSYFVALVRGKKPNHILHLLLSLITFGIWLPVWLILGLTMEEKIQTIEIDTFGNSIYQ